MEPEQATREWLETLDPVEFQEIARTISDIQRDREEARRRKLEERRDAARKKTRGGRYLRLERVKCGKKGCRKCSGEHPDLHGPYWYLYRPKKGSEGRTSEYVGKTLPDSLAEEFGIPEDERTAG
ncbi:MAG: hypothetical protein H0V28_01055 [Rubrobacteraceae bacterium]|nr:hypothetical protein [Rubrobacteraceae bacterium]